MKSIFQEFERFDICQNSQYVYKCELARKLKRRIEFLGTSDFFFDRSNKLTHSQTTKQTKEMSTLYTYSNANHEIPRDDGHGKQRILPPTKSSNFSSSIKIGLRLLVAVKSSSLSLNPPGGPLGVELDSVSIQQGCSMESTERNAVSHSGATAHHRGDTRLVAPCTYEKTSSGTDVLALLFAERNQQHHEEVGVGPQKKKKGEQNVFAAKIIGKAGEVTLWLSTGEERAPGLEDVVVPQASGGGAAASSKNEDASKKGTMNICLHDTVSHVTIVSEPLSARETVVVLVPVPTLKLNIFDHGCSKNCCILTELDDSIIIIIEGIGMVDKTMT